MTGFEFVGDEKRAVAKEAFMYAARKRTTTLDWEHSAAKAVAERQFNNWWEQNYE